MAGDILVVAISRRGFDRLAHEFSLPEGIVISPGPIGQNSRIKLGVDLIAYARFRVAFAGITIEELAISEDVDANTRLYGVESWLSDLLFGRLTLKPSALRAPNRWANENRR